MADALGKAVRPPKPKGGDRKDDGKPKNNAQAVREAEEAQLHSIMGQLQKQEIVVNQKKLEHDNAKATMTDIFRHAKAAGFTRKELEDLLVDEKSSRKDLAHIEERRDWLRTARGLPVGAQKDLLDNPQRTIIEWEAEGYLASLRGDDGSAPGGLAGEEQQAFLRGFHTGESKKAWAAAEAPPPPPKTATPPAAAPAQAPADPPSGDDNFEATPEELAAQTSRPRAQPEDESV